MRACLIAAALSLLGFGAAQAGCASAPAPYVNWSGCNMRGKALNGANLQHAVLIGTVLTGANLSGANLTGASLTDASLTNALWVDGTRACLPGPTGKCN